MIKISLAGIFISALCLTGTSQNFADLKTKDIDSVSRESILATSSNQFYTEKGSIAFNTLDSVKFFYEPSESLIRNLTINKVGYRIESLNLTEIETLADHDFRSELDWLVIANGDSLFGYIEERTDKIIFKNPLKNNYQKIAHSEILSYKKGEVVYENLNGMKILEIRGKVSLYSTTIYNSSMSGAGLTNSSPSVYYFVKRKTEKHLTLLSTKGTLRLNGTFKKDAAIYFRDCPKLVQRINNGHFKKGDPFPIVKYYNQNCDY